MEESSLAGQSPAARRSFARALAFTLRWEGGGRVSDDPHDPGGLTRWGISLRFLRRVEPDADAARLLALTRAEARALYCRHFWVPARCDELPPAWALLVFDAAVNCGQGPAVRWLQAATGAAVDGVIGPQTLACARRHISPGAIGEFNARRALYYARLEGFAHFGLGWLRRTFDAQAAALALAGEG